MQIATCLCPKDLSDYILCTCSLVFLYFEGPAKVGHCKVAWATNAAVCGMVQETN